MNQWANYAKNTDWQQLGADFKTFGERFAASDFAKIHPKPHEAPAVAGYLPRMAALIVWRRALLVLASVLSIILFIKTCFDPHDLESVLEKETYTQTIKAMEKAGQNPTSEQIDKIKEEAKASAKNSIKTVGESNAEIIDSLIGGLWLCSLASIVFQVMAARAWREWRKSRKLAIIGVAVLLGPQMVAMVIPWSSMMDFRHLTGQGFTTIAITQVKSGIQLALLFAILMSALPFFYGLVNGVLRASLSTKTLVPASIVCGWGSMLLACTIAVPWYIALSMVSQMQAEALIIMGVLCLLAAPLSIVFRSRKLGLPLTPEEATPLVKRTKMWLTGLNAVGVAMIIAFFVDKGTIGLSNIITLVIHYFANLMLVQVVAVDLLVLLLDRAHRKLAGDTTPDASLQQLGEVLSTK